MAGREGLLIPSAKKTSLIDDPHPASLEIVTVMKKSPNSMTFRNFL
jgi:hypothetical protein